jgi:hypothetical protein
VRGGEERWAPPPVASARRGGSLGAWRVEEGGARPPGYRRSRQKPDRVEHAEPPALSSVGRILFGRGVLCEDGEKEGKNGIKKY